MSKPSCETLEVVISEQVHAASGTSECDKPYDRLPIVAVLSVD